ncbi:MAG: methyltransferase domain-containing protein [bacterium]|nr:methyltransferase domain-containing protein [bacterium]
MESTFLHPERIVARFDLKPGEKAADFGAGGGFFTIPMARCVGPEGGVYAIDIQKHNLDVIKAKARLEHLLNIEYVWGNLEILGGSKIKNESVDFVIISNILFQAEKRQEVLREALRVLKKGGRCALLEWDESKFSFGPPMESRVPKRTAQGSAQSVGFELEKEFEAGSHHYGLMLRKPA